MARKIKVASGQRGISLDDGLVLKGGDTAVVSDDQFTRLSALIAEGTLVDLGTTTDPVTSGSDQRYTLDEIRSIIANELANPESASAQALSAAYVSLSQRPLNVRQTGDPLRDAIGDGGSHPLSARFGSLTAAQAKFPRATALTEQIDRHSLQYGLDNYGHVVAPDLGGSAYAIDTTLLTSAADTARGLGNQTFELQGAATLKLVSWKKLDTNIPNCILGSGNLRTVVNGANSPSTDTPVCPDLRFVNLRIDGNKASVAATGITGLYTIFCEGLDLDAEIFDTSGPGALLYGVSDVNTNNVLLRRAWFHGCSGTHAFGVSLRHRKVTYLDVKAWENDCTVRAIFIDHSESEAVSVQAWDNPNCVGIEVHNNSRNDLNGFRATGNGMHGILISGTTHSVGGDWVATGNGVLGTQYNDVHFDGRAGAYGVSQKSRFHDITCGAYTLNDTDTAHAGYALYVDDALNGDLEITGVKVAENEVLGDIRTPAAFGELAVQASAEGKGFPRWVCGGPDKTVVKTADQTINNTATLTDDDTLSFAVGGAGTWHARWVLALTGSDTAADAKFGVASPAGSSGKIMLSTGMIPTATGGTGAANPLCNPISGTVNCAAFAGSTTVVVEVVVTTTTAGNIGLQFAQNTATASNLTVGANSHLHVARLA